MSELHYHVNEIPGLTSILLFGFQQMMICISGLLVIPYYVANMVCAGPETLALRVQLIAATFVTSGIATLLQTTFGMRLSILHGPSFGFLPALSNFQSTFPCTPETDVSQWKLKMQLIFGSCLVSVLIIPLLGLTGFIGVMSRYIGPITIVPLMLLLTLGFVPDVEQKMSLHWISIVTLVILIILVVLLEETTVPIPYYSTKLRKFITTRIRIFSQFPYLMGISIAWSICLILTVSNALPADSAARTDNNDSLRVFEQTPWVQAPLPGQYGSPKLNIALICGFLASSLATMIESIGDYGICARISKQSRPPADSINRAFVVEGVGCMLAAYMGLGAGVTTYAENIALMSVTKVTSRITMQTAGIMLIVAGTFSKFAAFLAMIPEPVIGGVLAIGVCMINGVTYSNLQTVDLRLSRNLTIMGIAVIMGCVIPLHFETYPLQTGNKTIDEVFGTLLTIKMLIGGAIAFVLDNLTPGATRKQRGFIDEEDEDDIKIDIETNGYIFPSMVNRILLKLPWLSYLPILPNYEVLEKIEEERRNLVEDEDKITII
ncbi:unnamed protein product [Caenorhabditis angaria]|uniref:Uncharacterized protein n=1 Tax=Caenorhabditis angaria TaxID=860376 RepID=A0A9P1N1R5_9PELO|nr:unnamed protein product [Caenorhabditis angaria]